MTFGHVVWFQKKQKSLERKPCFGVLHPMTKQCDVNLDVQFSWRMTTSWSDFVAGAALCEPRGADFVAGAAFCGLGSADVVVCLSRCAPICKLSSVSSRTSTVGL